MMKRPVLDCKWVGPLSKALQHDFYQYYLPKEYSTTDAYKTGELEERITELENELARLQRENADLHELNALLREKLG